MRNEIVVILRSICGNFVERWLLNGIKRDDVIVHYWSISTLIVDHSIRDVLKWYVIIVIMMFPIVFKCVESLKRFANSSEYLNNADFIISIVLWGSILRCRKILWIFHIKHIEIYSMGSCDSRKQIKKLHISDEPPDEPQSTKLEWIRWFYHF